MKRLLCLAVLATSAAAPAGASDFKQFRDWFAACDNLRNCAAYGFDTELSGGSYLRLERGGAPDAPVKVAVTAQVPKNAAFTLRFDDAALPGLPAGPQSGEPTDSDELRRVTVPVTPALIDSLRKAKTIVVTRSDPPGGALKDDERVSSISLSGAVAALLWVDEQQKRLDTTTALIKRGTKPASTVPAQPAAPVIIAARPSSAKAPKPPASLLARARKACDGVAKTDDDNAADGLAPDLFLYSFFCPERSGAYNMHSAYFIVPAGQPKSARPATRAVSFRWPVKIGDIEQDDDAGTTAVNASFDAKTMTLNIFNKGRGLGDCGTEENWVFDGKTFRVAEIRLMPECRGVLPEDWPVVYRAQVKR